MYENNLTPASCVGVFTTNLTFCAVSQIFSYLQLCLKRWQQSKGGKGAGLWTKWWAHTVHGLEVSSMCGPPQSHVWRQPGDSWISGRGVFWFCTASHGLSLTRVLRWSLLCMRIHMEQRARRSAQCRGLLHQPSCHLPRQVYRQGGPGHGVRVGIFISESRRGPLSLR